MAAERKRKIQGTYGFTERQEKLLRAEAKRLDTTPSDVLRRILDSHFDSRTTNDPRASKMYAT